MKGFLLAKSHAVSAEGQWERRTNKEKKQRVIGSDVGSDGKWGK